MADVTLRHELECTEEQFWDTVFSRGFNNALYNDVLKFPRFEIVSVKDEGNTKVKKVRIEPPLTGVPGPVMKVIGDKFGYTEDGTWDKAKKRYTFVVTPTTMAEKSKTSGEMWCERISDTRIARIAKIRVEVKVFMVGGMIEDKIMDDLKRSFETSARFINDYVKQNPTIPE